MVTNAAHVSSWARWRCQEASRWPLPAFTSLRVNCTALFCTVADEVHCGTDTAGSVRCICAPSLQGSPPCPWRAEPELGELGRHGVATATFEVVRPGAKAPAVTSWPWRLAVTFKNRINKLPLSTLEILLLLGGLDY